VLMPRLAPHNRGRLISMRRPADQRDHPTTQRGTCAGRPLGMLYGIYCRNPSGSKNKFTGVKTNVMPNRLQGLASFFNRGANPWSRFGLTLILFPVNYFLDTVLWAGPGIDFT